VASTLKDVAARAGVSIKTVSNVVNDRPYVTEQTRLKVLSAVEELRYRPNASARSLRNAKVGVLAVAIPDLANAYFADIGTAVIAAAARRSYTVLLDHTRGDRDQEALVANGLRPHLIDGVILSPLVLEMNDLLPDRIAIPLVLLGERLVEAPWDHVVIDNVAAARMATRHLLDLGRRHIAAIGVPHDVAGHASLAGASGATKFRLQGYMEALGEAGQSVDPRLLVAPEGLRRPDGTQAHREDGAQAVRRLLALSNPPDAVFCFNDLVALGAIRALHEAGRRVPDDVAVVGFDDLDEGRFSTPTLTTISPDKEQIADSAVSLLLGRIDGTLVGPPARVEPPFRLVIRESTAGAGAPSAI
jgi:DNA-binding LacI/PurR family transcriptional regulator